MDNARCARLQELEEARRQLDEERKRLQNELENNPGGGPTHAKARVVQQHLVNEGKDTDDAQPVFNRASQNLTAAAVLLCECPEPATLEERKTRQQLRTLLEAAAVQQAESSASRQRGSKASGREQTPRLREAASS